MSLDYICVAEEFLSLTTICIDSPFIYCSMDNTSFISVFNNTVLLIVCSEAKANFHIFSCCKAATLAAEMRDSL